MCRVRFGLTGIYFDSLEPNRPREVVFQPLISALPPIVQNRQCDVVSKVMDGEAIKGAAVSAKESSDNDEDGGQTQTTKDQSDSSSSSSRDEEGHPWAENAQTNQTSVGSKRARDASSLSSSSSSSDEDQFHKSANSKISRIAFRNPESINSATQKRTDKPSQPGIAKALGGSSKAPPAKRVRFAMDVQESLVPCDDASDTSSSHSSDDSYTDPPSPTEPYDAFAGYCRTSGASRSHRMNRRVAGSRTQFPAEEEINTDGADDFLHSENGSEVDVQGLPVKGRPPRTVRAAGTGQTSDQRHHKNSSTPLPRSKHSGRVMDQSRVMGGGLESNVDGWLPLEKSYASQKECESPLRSGGQLRYPKLRSGKILPEPIFVVRPRFLSEAKENGKRADKVNGRGHSRGISEDGHEGTKTPPHRPTPVKDPKNPPPPNTGPRQSATT